MRLLALLLVLVASGCASAADSSIAASTANLAEVERVEVAAAVPAQASATAAIADEVDPADSDAESSQVEAPEPTGGADPRALAAADTELAPAPIGFDNIAGSEPTGPTPISIVIEDIDVDGAEVIPVGVNEDLTFEVPPAEQVGWYEFGSSPGEAGSAVLAAHIAYNGVDGVFRYLEDVDIGAVVIVGFDDGTSRRYQIEGVTEYVKEALPDSLFARDGREQLALITCGGAFDHDLRSYESNTVAVAIPLD